MSADSIDNLPTDQSVPSNNEIRILDSLFKQKLGTVNRILSQSKDVLLIGALFILLSLPQIDSLIHSFIPITARSPYILILMKALFLMFLYFVFKNLYLVRKKS